MTKEQRFLLYGALQLLPFRERQYLLAAPEPESRETEYERRYCASFVYRGEMIIRIVQVTDVRIRQYPNKTYTNQLYCRLRQLQK